MSGLLKVITVLFCFCLLGVSACSKDYVPTEPPAGTGTTFQRTPEEIQDGVRNALTKLNFAITIENEQYIEAVHLKPGETVEKNKSEIVGVWMKPREGSVLVLIDTVKTASGIAKQRDWEQDLMRQILREMQ